MVSDVIRQAPFQVDPWCLRETALDLEFLAQGESVLALSNGHVGWRANLDEGEPHDLPGSYLNGVYEERPLPHAEAGYGLPQSGRAMIIATNGKLIRLLVDDEPFDIRYGTPRCHLRLLDFRVGSLLRRLEWSSPSGPGGADRVDPDGLAHAAGRGRDQLRVQPLDRAANVVLQSELVASEQLPTPDGDPRVPAVLEGPLADEEHAGEAGRAILIQRTTRSGLRLAAAMHKQIALPGRQPHGGRNLARCGPPPLQPELHQPLPRPPIRNRAEPVQPPGRAPARRTPPGPPATRPGHTTAVS
jgi:alpha,alpha-trehalose phosphorylase